MADGVQIESLDELRDWLKTQDVRVSQTIAARAALRALPAVMPFVDKKLGKLDGDRCLLACLHSTMAAAVASTCQSADVQQMKSIALYSTGAEYARVSAPSNAATAAAAAACLSAFDTEQATTRAILAISAASAHTPDYSSLATAAALLERLLTIDRGSRAAFETPLWTNLTPLSNLFDSWQTFQKRSDPENVWAFWMRWYRGMFDGKPLDWDLQYKVVSISKDIRNAGPAAVAEKIREVEAKWALEREIAALKKQLAEAKQAIAQPNRLHNQPPEAIDDSRSAFRTDVSLIWNKLEELEEEVQRPNPSPSKLLEIAAWISDKAISIVQYCGSVADEMLRAGGKAYASAAGKTAGAATVAAVSLPDGMKTVAELIETIVALIGG